MIKQVDNIFPLSKMCAKKSENPEHFYPSIDELEKYYRELETEGKDIGYRKRRFLETNVIGDYETNQNPSPGSDEKHDLEINKKCKSQRRSEMPPRNYKVIIGIIALVIFMTFFVYDRVHKTSSAKINVLMEVEYLKLKYSNQSSALWQNVLKIVNSSEDTVHSFILLYKGKGAHTAECFARDLIGIINKIYDNSKVILFKNKSYVTDYGKELNDYLGIVRESKHMIVPELQKVNGDIARMFHTLCEVNQYSIRPSYFIFTLEDMSESIAPGLQNKNPYVRVGNILRRAWSNLAENELHPLISRIVRNVAEILNVNVSC